MQTRALGRGRVVTKAPRAPPTHAARPDGHSVSLCRRALGPVCVREEVGHKSGRSKEKEQIAERTTTERITDSRKNNYTWTLCLSDALREAVERIMPRIITFFIPPTTFGTSVILGIADCSHSHLSAPHLLQLVPLDVLTLANGNTLPRLVFQLVSTSPPGLIFHLVSTLPRRVFSERLDRPALPCFIKT